MLVPFIHLKINGKDPFHLNCPIKEDNPIIQIPINQILLYQVDIYRL